MVNSKDSLSKIPSTNHDGTPYILDLDIYKEGYWSYDISNYYKGRVGDNGTPFQVRWFEHGQIKNVQGLRPFIRGTVGQHTVDDETDPDNPKVVPSPDCSQIDQTGETTDTMPGGIAVYRMVNQCFTQEGIFYGEIGLKDSSGLVLSSVDIAFKVLGGRMNMLGARKFYVTELEKALAEFKEKSAELQEEFQGKMNSNEQDFNARMTTELQNLQDHVNSYLSQYEGAVKYNIGSLNRLSAVASSIDAELKALDVANKQDFENLKKDIVTKLSQMQLTPKVITNLQELSTKYPEGAMGVFVTADDGCIAFYDGNQWQKGAKFNSTALSLKSENRISENNAVSKALLENHSGQLIYSFHGSKTNTFKNKDNSYLRVASLPKGFSKFLVSLKSDINTKPSVLFAEKQADENYIAKSICNLKKPTGEVDTTVINYAVNNENTYLFLGGGPNVFECDTIEADGQNTFVQLPNEVSFNASVKPLFDENNDTDPNNHNVHLNLAGINVTVIGLEPSNYAYISNYANNYLDSHADKTSNHFWSIGEFKKDDYLTKMILQNSDPNAIVEIREQINGKYVLKKRLKPSSFNNQVFYLNYLAENDGLIFLHGVFNYKLDNFGELYEYDSMDEELELSPTSNIHRLLAQVDIYKLKNPNSVKDLIGQIVYDASQKASDNIMNRSSVVLFSNLDRTDLTGVANIKNHYWNAMDFHKGDIISKVVLDTDDPDAKIEIRENLDGKYVLKKRIGVSFDDFTQAYALPNYTAENDGILFVSGAVKYSPESSGQPLYEYDETTDPITLTATPDQHGFYFGLEVYSFTSLLDQTVQKTLIKGREELLENQDTKIKNKFDNFNKLIPRLKPTDTSFELLGRWYTKKIADESYYVTNNAGAQLYFKITNASYFDINWKHMYSQDYARWAYALDDGDYTSISTSQTRVDIPDKDTHIIRIVTDAIYQGIGKWDQGNGFAFNKISTDGTLIGLTPIDPVIMYFGDSITEGIRTLGMDEKGPGCSVLQAYSWISAQNLHAHPYLVGYGGTGLYNKGSFNTSDYSVDWMSQGIPEKIIFPNLIIVNLGTNDGAVKDDEFDDLYKKFVNKLIRKYPGVPIACMIPFNQARALIITKIAQQTKDCILVDTNGWDIETTDGTHPTAKGSEKAGFNLAKEIYKNLGWNWAMTTIPEQPLKI